MLGDTPNLPLSWAVVEEEELTRFRSFTLPSGMSFVVNADVPISWSGTRILSELTERYPKGFLLRGVSAEFVSQLSSECQEFSYQKLSLGSSAVLEGGTFKPDKKLRNLVRRGEQELEFGWLNMDAESAREIQSLKEAAREADTPAVEYFFRTDLLSCHAAYGARRKGGRD